MVHCLGYVLVNMSIPCLAHQQNKNSTAAGTVPPFHYIHSKDLGLWEVGSLNYGNQTSTDWFFEKANIYVFWFWILHSIERTFQCLFLTFIQAFSHFIQAQSSDQGNRHIFHLRTYHALSQFDSKQRSLAGLFVLILALAGLFWDKLFPLVLTSCFPIGSHRKSLVCQCNNFLFNYKRRNYQSESIKQVFVWCKNLISSSLD